MVQDLRDTASARDLARKVECLSDPDCYQERPFEVEVVETHMSWVFLAGSLVYKLKKPVVVFPYLDFRTLEARRRNCLEEVRLNRRLAPWVYLGVTPLARTGAGGLELDGAGTPVEWLVKMRRLPRAAMLEQAAANGRARVAAIRGVAGVLTDFYLRAEPALRDAHAYLERMRTALDGDVAALSHPQYRIGRPLLEWLRSVLAGFIERSADCFMRRVEEGRILEGHGDLRPEHVCLLPRPVIIDCLEFDRELRILAVAAEMAFLALECDRLDAPFIGRTLFHEYGSRTGDHPPDQLIAFYQCRRAMRRAQQCLSHLLDGPTSLDIEQKWRQRAGSYLDWARIRAESCNQGAVS